ncbi:hypothetical protein [Kaistia sp. MMO-174]|uniref:hypothetical protein n=1 Tax=Kaistia sp. MMO-174 TaxID=3081256 RepID=UPI0030181CB6
MCRLCETRLLADRVARQIKNIDEGGAVSLDAIREILGAAYGELRRTIQIQQVTMGMLLGDLVAEGGGIDLESVIQREGRH